MKNGFRYVVITALLAVVSVLMCIGASADAEIFYGKGDIGYFGDAAGEDVSSVAAESSGVSGELIDYVIEMHRQIAVEIPIYEAGYRVSFTAHSEIMMARTYKASDLFYADSSYMYSYIFGEDEETVYLYSLYPDYTMYGEELEKAKAKYESMISDIEAQAKHLSGDLEKVIFYHDYIVSNFEYDTSYVIHDAYNMLLSKQGVCQAYTLLMTELLTRAGIENTAIYSDGLNHVWNAVLLDGGWYLLDLTWDDPIDDIAGRVYRHYFLCSKKKFEHALRDGSYDWVTVGADEPVFSASLDSAFWHSSENHPIHVYDGNAYYKTYSYGREYSIIKVDLSDMSESLFLEKSVYQYMSLGFCGYGNRLYYVQSFEMGAAMLYEYDIDTGAERVIYTYTHICTESCFQYCSISMVRLFSDDNRLYIYTANGTYSNDGTLSYIDVEEYSVSFILYDCNGDGAVNNADITALIRELSGFGDNSFVFSSADINCDGKLNNRDAIALIKHLS